MQNWLSLKNDYWKEYRWTDRLKRRALRLIFEVEVVADFNILPQKLTSVSVSYRLAFSITYSGSDKPFALSTLHKISKESYWKAKNSFSYLVMERCYRRSKNRIKRGNDGIVQRKYVPSMKRGSIFRILALWNIKNEAQIFENAYLLYCQVGGCSKDAINQQSDVVPVDRGNRLV